MKEWWQQFFIPVTAEVMFQPRFFHVKNEVQQIIKQVPMPKKARVLDLACGTGRH